MTATAPAPSPRTRGGTAQALEGLRQAREAPPSSHSSRSSRSSRSSGFASVPRWRRAIAAGLAWLAALALAACGSGDDSEVETNGVEDLPAEEVEQQAKAAARRASAVLLSGTVRTGGASYRIDMRLSENGALGEVSAEGGSPFELLRVGEELYLKADAAFWESENVPEELESDPAKKLDDKYVRVAPDDPAYGEFSGFTDKNVLLDGLLALEGERETGERGEVGGAATLRIVAGRGAGGAMDVALVGPPYPLRLERGGGAGQVTLADWNEGFDLQPPKDQEVVDYGDGMVTGEGGGQGGD